MIIIAKRAVLLLVLMILIVSFLILNLGNVINSNATVSYTVVIDPGHGSPDGGSEGDTTGVLEKDLTLSLSCYLKEELLKQGINVIMTRDGDSAVYTNAKDSLREQKRKDLNSRLSIAEKSRADLMISIHMNHFSDSRYSGPQIFFSESVKESDRLASLLRESILKNIGEHCTREIKPNNELFLLKNAVVPTVIAECGFLSNPEEEKLLSSQEYQKKLAAALSEGIKEFLA